MQYVTSNPHHETPAVLVVSPVVAGRDGVADGACFKKLIFSGYVYDEFGAIRAHHHSIKFGKLTLKRFFKTSCCKFSLFFKTKYSEICLRVPGIFPAKS